MVWLETFMGIKLLWINLVRFLIYDNYEVLYSWCLRNTIVWEKFDIKKISSLVRHDKN